MPIRDDEQNTNKPPGSELVESQLARVRKYFRGAHGKPMKASEGSSATNDASTGSSSTKRAKRRYVDDFSNRDVAARPNAPRDPVLLGSAVEGLIKERDWKKQTEVATVLGQWSELMGREFSEHVKPVEFNSDDAILVLQADSTSWATQTKLLTSEILGKLDERVGSGVVKSIDVLGPEPVRKKRGKFNVKGRGPRDTYG